MTIQTGITIAGADKPYTVVHDIPRPVPGPKQALVKTLVVGINAVEPFMQHYGALIHEFPAVLGSDVCGLVMEAGADCKRLAKGDLVFGCVRIGQNQYSPFQEAFLVDDDLFFKNGSLTKEEAATVGVGLLTAGLGVLPGLNVKLPEAGTAAEETESWIIILGGSGSVGQFACQVGKLCGYKVLASCSPSKAKIALKAGATATFNNRDSLESQLSEIKRITGGSFGRVFDSSIVSFELAIKALEEVSVAKEKYFSSADDWTEMKVAEGINVYRVQLGHLGEDSSIGEHVSGLISSWIPALESHLASGKLRPLEYQAASGLGFDKVIEGIADLEAGKATKKIVVTVQES